MSQLFESRKYSLGFYGIVLYSLLRIAELTYFQSPTPELLYLFIFLAMLTPLYILKEVVDGSFRLTYGKVLMIFLMLSLVTVVTLQFFFLKQNIYDQDGRSVFEYTKGLIYTAYVWLLIGAAISNSRVRASLWMPFLLLGSCFWLLKMGAFGGIFVDYNILSVLYGTERMSHLAIEDYVVFICMAAYILSPRVIKPVVFLGMLLLVIMCGGRSALFMSVLSIFLFEYKNKEYKLYKNYIYIVAFFSIVVVLSGIGLDYSDDSVRKMLLLDGLDSDLSKQERDVLLSGGFLSLQHQALIGDPNIIVSMFGTLGAYIHNIVSAWQFFGVFIFTLLIWCLIYSVKKMIFISDACGGKNGVVNFGVLTLIYTVISVVFTKFVGFSFLWFSIGFWCFYDARRPVSATLR